MCSEAIWCWVCPVLSPELQMPLSAAGKHSSQAAHSQFSQGCAEAGSGCLPWPPARPLPAQHSVGLSHTGKTETASASGSPFGLKGFSGAFFPEQTAGISCHAGQGPPAALLGVVLSKLLVSGIHHRAPSLHRAAPACVCPPFGTGGTTGNRPGAASPFP